MKTNPTANDRMTKKWTYNDWLKGHEETIHKATFKRIDERYLFFRQMIKLGHEKYHVSWKIHGEETHVAWGPFGNALFVLHYTEHGGYRGGYVG